MTASSRIFKLGVGLGLADRILMYLQLGVGLGLDDRLMYLRDFAGVPIRKKERRIVFWRDWTTFPLYKGAISFFHRLVSDTSPRLPLKL